MTRERQADVRGNLYSMLGDRGQVAAASSSSSSRTKEHSRSSTKEHSRSSTKEYSTKSKEGSSTTGCDSTSSFEATPPLSSDSCHPLGGSPCSGTSVLFDELRVRVTGEQRGGGGGGEDAGRTGGEPVQSPIGVQNDVTFVNDIYGDSSCNNYSNVSTKSGRNDDNVHSNQQGVGGSSKYGDKDRDNWVCDTCTLINEAAYRRCFTCNSMRNGCRE